MAGKSMKSSRHGGRRWSMGRNSANKSTRDETEEAAATWLLRRSSPQWSERDQAELDQWLAASAGHLVSFMRLESVWTETERLRSIASGLPKGQIPPRGAIERSPFFTIRQAETADKDPLSDDLVNPNEVPLSSALE